MFSPASIFGLRPLLIASAMLVCWAFAPNQAKAGCGDYSMPDHNPNLQQRIGKDGKSPIVPICHGPHCKQSPVQELPMREAPVRVINSENDLTVVVLDLPSFVTSSRPLPSDQESLNAADLISSIFHPPR